jgi:hypothetical protein
MSDIANGAPGPDLPGPGPHPQGPAAAAEPPVPLPRAVLYGSVGSVWVVSALLAVLIGVLSPHSGYASWLSLALGVSVLLAFAAQLATQRKDGFVNRLAATLTGSFLILGVTGAILAIVSAAS